MFRNDGQTGNDNHSFQSLPDCTPGQERLAVVAVYRNCPPEDRDRVLDILGLTGTAEAMLAARDERAG